MSVITCRSNVLRGTRSPTRKLQNEAQYNYVGGASGPWRVTGMTALCGPPPTPVTHVNVIKGELCRTPVGACWVLSGSVRNTRYVTRENLNSSGLGSNAAAPCAALIAVRRSAEWWELGHQVRHEILETQSDHLKAGLHYLSGIVRRWHSRRDLSQQFDCVTWFEYEPRDSAAFDNLLSTWRASEEWNYVDRECDIRLVGGR